MINLGFSSKVAVVTAGLAVAATMGAASAGAEVIELSPDGIVNAGGGATVREVGASGTNEPRGVDRLSVFSGLKGSHVSTSTVYVVATTACTNAPALNYTDVKFVSCKE